MKNKLFVTLQKLLPQHLLTVGVGKLAASKRKRIKNLIIKYFMRAYGIQLNEALEPDWRNFPDFNSFFTRELHAHARPIVAGKHTLACPADGAIAQMGTIQQNQLLQAKGSYFDLESFLVDEMLAYKFYDGSYATIYLAPSDYHRVHMPLDGVLVKTLFVPGKLFSVNRITSHLIPNLYSRNERLIALFDTAAGPMAIVLVGAMIVGSIQPSWMDKPIRAKKITVDMQHAGLELCKGAEIGHFKLGSTVVVLFGKDKIRWSDQLGVFDKTKFGQNLGDIIL